MVGLELCSCGVLHSITACLLPKISRPTSGLICHDSLVELFWPQGSCYLVILLHHEEQQCTAMFWCASYYCQKCMMFLLCIVLVDTMVCYQSTHALSVAQRDRYGEITLRPQTENCRKFLHVRRVTENFRLQYEIMMMMMITIIIIIILC